MTLFNKIRDIVSKQLNVDESEIKPESKLTDDLGADSVDLAELIFIMEEKFDIEISDKDTKDIVTVGDAVKAVEERIINRK
ncbi:Acyl carrier protein [subsurface metagenome]